MTPGLHALQERPLLLRADRRGRRDRALELPLVDPLRRGRDRADGGQRRGAEAGQPDAAAGRADPRGVRAAAALPEGLVRVVHGGGAVGEALARSSVGKVFFTGSVEVGRHVGEVCASELKGSVLELGGKDPMIVCADADLDNAVTGAVWGGFANAGQTCSGIERVYVMREVADRFVAGVAREAERLRIGDPLQWETEIGPMTSESQYEIVIELIEDAVAAGRDEALRRARSTSQACPASSSRRPSSPASPMRCGSCARRSSGRCCRSSSSTPSRRRSTSPTTPSSGSAPRSGRGPGARRTDRPRPRVGDGLDQRPLLQPRRLPVLLGRGQGLGPRTLPLQIRLLRVRRHQDERLGAGADPGLLVAPLRPHPGRGGARLREACSTAAARCGRRRSATAPDRCCGSAGAPIRRG